MMLIVVYSMNITAVCWPWVVYIDDLIAASSTALSTALTMVTKVKNEKEVGAYQAKAD